jgi:hypothetical protein
MTELECDKEVLSLYAFGALADVERKTVDRHVSWCADCCSELAEFEEVTGVLAELPPEALLLGPPGDGDLVLQRTLRLMRDEMSGVRRRRNAVGSLIAVGVIAAAMTAGAALGRSTVTQAGPVVQVTSAPPSAAPGERHASADDPRTDVSLTATLVPADGWVRIKVSARGIPAGENCKVIVVSRSGAREVAGSWTTSEKGKRYGTTLEGAAAVAPNDVVAIVIENTLGKKFFALKI